MQTASAAASVPAAGEDGQTPEQRLLGRLEQVVTPGKRLAQRLLSLRQIGCPTRQQWEAALEPLQ